MTRKKWLLSFLVFLGIFIASYSIGAEMPVTDEEAMEFLKEFQASVEGIDAIGIFLHNMSIGLPMFIPGFGMAWGAYSGLSTGFAFSALVVSIPALEEIPPLALLFTSPFGMMELVAYSIGMSRSFFLIFTLVKKKPIKPELKPTAIEIGIAVALLLIGGFIEHMMMAEFSELPTPS